MRIEKNASANTLSTYKGGGVIKTLYLPETEDEFCSLQGAYILGGGSNVIVANGEISTPVASTKLLNRVWIDDGKIHAQAGARVSSVMAEARKYGLGGLEFLAGVPATVGGIVKMNAGAFLHETKDYVDKIKVSSGVSAKWIDARNIPWGYRSGVDGMIVEVAFRLEDLPVDESKARAKRCVETRGKTQPRLPSVGSVFKNADMPAGKYIELCGLKGKRIGGAEISALHANFIVNVGGGSASDFFSLVRLAEYSVKEKFGITLEREFEVLE